jgi:hypothetical protein
MINVEWSNDNKRPTHLPQYLGHNKRDGAQDAENMRFQQANHVRRLHSVFKIATGYLHGGLLLRRFPDANSTILHLTSIGFQTDRPRRG